jgi:hypothetical protein
VASWWEKEVTEQASMSGYVAISGLIYGTTAGTVTVGPYTVAANTDNNFDSSTVSIATGENTISVPSWAVGVSILTPQAGTQNLVLKGASGDTGIVIAPNQACLLNFDTVTPDVPSSFVLDNPGSDAVPTQITFF